MLIKRRLRIKHDFTMWMLFMTLTGGISIIKMEAKYDPSGLKKDGKIV